MIDLKFTVAFNNKINMYGFIYIKELKHILLLTY